MKSVAALVFLVAGGMAQYEPIGGSTQVNDPEHIARLNAEEGSLWRAAPQKFFEGLSFDEARVFLGARLSHISQHLNETLPEGAFAVAVDDLPSDFDSRKQWPGLLHPIRDQQQCGSCWAFSATEVLSDRVAIATGAESPVLSAEDIVSCDKEDDGCDGGELPSAWKYLVHTGVVTDSCWPYSAGGGHAPKCRHTCVDSERFTRTKAKSSYAIQGAVNMQKDLLQNGPIQVGFKVYSSFMSYESGIYHKLKREKEPEGGHAVKIVGWGVQTARDYWTVANSWGTEWGEEGYFKIRRGDDECGIEKWGPPYAGLPVVSQEEILV